MGDHNGAGACHELIGDELQAAESYQRAGDVEKLETVLQREEQRRKRFNRVRDAFDEYRLELAAGQRDRALEAITYCAEAPLPSMQGPGAAERAAELMRDRASYQRLKEELEQKLVADGVLTLRSGRAAAAKERRYVGSFPLVMGRDPACQLQLRDGGISRHHAEIKIGSDGRFVLHDHGSKNGTKLRRRAHRERHPARRIGRDRARRHMRDRACDQRRNAESRALYAVIDRGRGSSPRWDRSTSTAWASSSSSMAGRVCRRSAGGSST